MQDESQPIGDQTDGSAVAEQAAEEPWHCLQKIQVPSLVLLTEACVAAGRARNEAKPLLGAKAHPTAILPLEANSCPSCSLQDLWSPHGSSSLDQVLRPQILLDTAGLP